MDAENKIKNEEFRSDMTERIDVVKIVVKNSEGLILAVREADSKKWELPGGKIGSSEERFEAA